MTLTSAESVSDIKLHRSAAHTMFEIILAQWHLINIKTDGELVRCVNIKRNRRAEFKKYVDKFEELLNPPPPPLRRSARLRARKAPK